MRTLNVYLHRSIVNTSERAVDYVSAFSSIVHAGRVLSCADISPALVLVRVEVGADEISNFTDELDANDAVESYTVR